MDESTVEQFTLFGMDPQIVLIKAVYLLVVVAVAFVVQRLLGKVVKRALNAIEGFPTATILVNIVRIAVWVFALLLVLEPVFGVDATGFFAAMGVASIVISYGLKDTIANVIGGIMLMAGRVVQPGDYVTIAGVTGTVVDITLRHTVVENRLDEHVVIPNSVLNSTSIYRLPASSESMGTFEFTMESGHDPDVVAADIVATVKHAAGDKLRPDMEPKVMFDSVTPYGVKGQVFFYVDEGIPFAGVRNAMVRALAQKDYFSLKGARALTGEAVEEFVD